ncbi:MAG TPA: long-chain-fatty-acid--CoA ligase [Steroidobacteraceae bacterium]|nr:long-chain-fatty-acid--CoA ligase [Steroidobacteraceae bacterium]
MAPERLTEADALRYHSQQRPDHPAIVFRDRVTTYRELDSSSNRIANGLCALSVPRGGRVAILAKNSSDFFELLFGILKAGMTVLPLNWRLAVPEITAILCDAAVEALIVEDTFAPVVPQLRASCPTLAHVIVTGAPLPATGDVGLHLGPWRAAHSAVDPLTPVSPEDIMIQFYTSGTTGDPKGVQISHRSSSAMRRMEVESAEDWMQWSADDVAIVALPNFHLSGTSWALQWLARGATCVVQEQVDPGAFLQAIPRYRVTQLFAVPTVIDLMLASPALPTLDLSSLRVIYYGGAPMSPALLTRALAAFRCSFVQIYGMTENNGTICYLTPADHLQGDTRLLASCGRPLPSIDLRILDAGGHEKQPGDVGEICIRSPSLMSGYWRREALTQSSFHGRHFRTGDAGYRNERGYLFLVDRLKDMIVSGGENIYPAELERVLFQHPVIADVAVVGVPDPRWGEAVTAVVVRKTADLDADEVIRCVKSRLAAYKAPKRVVFVDALPRNANGKVLKRVLRDRLTTSS